MVLRLSFWRKQEEEIVGEQHKQPGRLSDFILGSQDGLVNVLGVILGVAIASQDFGIILAGGLAATFAESISMGAVAYTTTIARREFYLSELARETSEITRFPDTEKREVMTILRGWGVEPDSAKVVVEQIARSPKAWLDIMMAHELKLQPVEKGEAAKSAILVGIAAIVGSIIPLVPFVLTEGQIFLGIAISLLISASALFVIGWYKAKTTVGRPARSGLQMLVIGISSALAGFGVAYLVSGGQGL